MFFTLIELLELLIMVVAIGFIFSGFIAIRPKTVYDMMHPKRFNFDDFKFAMLVVAPAIVLHELAHKFVAIGFGVKAVFHMSPLGLGIGILLKLFSSPFIILAPGYVTIPFQLVTDLQYRLIAFAGPFMNLVLWLGSKFYLDKAKKLSLKNHAFWALTKRINMILFFFNMIPFGFFDGAKVIFGKG